MAAYITAEDLEFGMATPRGGLDAMAAAGFMDGRTRSRDAWYKVQAREELARLQGDAGRLATEVVGPEFVETIIGIRQRMIPVLDSGEHCPTHLLAQKPGGRGTPSLRLSLGKRPPTPTPSRTTPGPDAHPR